MKITHELDLDVSRQGVQATVPISQNDAGVHQVVIRLRNGGVPIIPQEGDHACLYIPDGDIFDPVTVYAEQSAKPGRLVYDVTAAASATVGKREVVLQIANGEGLTLYSPHFAFIVKADLTGGSRVTSSPAYAAVIQAQAVAENALAETEELQAQAQDALEEAENVRTEAGSAVENAKEWAGESKKAAQGAQLSADASAASAGTATEQAEAAAKSAEDAEQSKQDAQAILDESEEKAQEALAGKAAEILQDAKDYTDSEVASLSLVKVVASLPAVGNPNRMYLVPKSLEAENDIFDEYLWVNKGTEEEPVWAWEWISTTQIEVDVDLAEYIKKTDYATDKSVGVVRCSHLMGLYVDPTTGQISIVQATNDEIDERTQRWHPITPFNLDYAVQSAGEGVFVKKTDYATDKVPGIVRCAYLTGFYVDPTNGNMSLVQATTEDIDKRSHRWHPITPFNLDYAVKSAGTPLFAKKDVERKVKNLEEASVGKLYYEYTVSGTSVSNPFSLYPQSTLPYMLLSKIGDISAKILPTTIYTLPETVGGLEIPQAFRTKYASLCVGGNYFDLVNQVVKQQEVRWGGKLTVESVEYESAADGTGTSLSITVTELKDVAMDKLSDVSYEYFHNDQYGSETNGIMTNFTYAGYGVFTAETFTYGAQYYTDEEGNPTEESDVDYNVSNALETMSFTFTMNKGGGADVAIEVDFDLYIDGATAGETITGAPELELVYMTKINS